MPVLRLKKFVVLVLAFIILPTAFVLAGNPATPILPSDNIQDPGDPGTAWGGCGPSDSNCYVTVTNWSFSNGLTNTSGTVRLGGNLTQNTAIDGQNQYSFDLDQLSAYNVDVTNNLGNTMTELQMFNGGFYLGAYQASGIDEISLDINPGSFYLFNDNDVDGNTDLYSWISGGNQVGGWDLYGQLSSAFMRIKTSTTTSNSSYQFTNVGTSAYSNNFLIDQTGFELSSKPVSSGGTLRGIKIDLNGNVGINNNTPLYRLDVLNNITSQTTSNRVANFSNAGATFNTTAGPLSSYGGYFSSTSTRSAGANTLTNIGLYATASGAQNNYAAIFNGGGVSVGLPVDSGYDFQITDGSRIKVGFDLLNKDYYIGDTNEMYLHIDEVSLEAIGDINTTRFSLEDNNQLVTFSGFTDYDISTPNYTGNVFEIRDNGAGALNMVLGDVSAGANNTKITIDDLSHNIILNTNHAGGVGTRAYLDIASSNQYPEIYLQSKLNDNSAYSKIYQNIDGSSYSILDLETFDSGGSSQLSLSGGSILASTTTMTINSDTTTGTALDVSPYALTTGMGLSMSSSTLSSGSLVNLSVASTAAVSNTQKVLNITTSGVNATSTQTTYGAYLSNTHTGTSSTNVGLYVTASGGTNNYAAIFEGGNVGIGTTTPAAALDVIKTTEQVRIGYDSSKYFTTTVGSSGTVMYELSQATASWYWRNGIGSQSLFIGGSADGYQALLRSTDGDAGADLTLRGDLLGSQVYFNLSADDDTNPVVGITGDAINQQLSFDAAKYIFNGNIGIGDVSPASLLTVGLGDLFQVNSSGAIVAATGIVSSGTIQFSALTTNGALYTSGGNGTLTTTAPTSGAIGYWSRSGTTLSPTTANDLVSISTNSTTASNKALEVLQTGATVGTDYAGYFSNTGAATTNTGLYTIASGASSNYALYAVSPGGASDLAAFFDSSAGTSPSVQIQNETATGIAGVGFNVGGGYWAVGKYGTGFSGDRSGSFVITQTPIFANGVDALRINSSREVFIGGSTTDAGAYILQVAGDLLFDGGAIFNESGADKDFRIEGDTDINLFFVDASTDQIGIGTNGPSYKLDVTGTGRFTSNLTVYDYIIHNTGGLAINKSLTGLMTKNGTNNVVIGSGAGQKASGDTNFQSINDSVIIGAGAANSDGNGSSSSDLVIIGAGAMPTLGAITNDANIVAIGTDFNLNSGGTVVNMGSSTNNTGVGADGVIARNSTNVSVFGKGARAYNTGGAGQEHANSSGYSYLTVLGSEAIGAASSAVVLGRTSDDTLIGAISKVSGTFKLQVTGNQYVSGEVNFGSTTDLGNYRLQVVGQGTNGAYASIIDHSLSTTGAGLGNGLSLLAGGTALNINSNFVVSGAANTDILTITQQSNSAWAAVLNNYPAGTGKVLQLVSGSSTANVPILQVDNAGTPGSTVFGVYADGKVGIGDITPAALLTVGSGDLFQVNSSGNILGVFANATTDTDRFLVSDSGTIKYRTGTELRSDIGAAGVSGTPVANQIAFWDSSGTVKGSTAFTVSDALYPSLTVGSSANAEGTIAIIDLADTYVNFGASSGGATMYGSSTYRGNTFYSYAGGNLFAQFLDSAGVLTHDFKGRISTNTLQTGGSNLGAFNIDRTFAEASSGNNQHGYVDKTVFRYGGSAAFNAFYAENTIGATNAGYTQDHWAGFQTRITKDGANTVNNLYDFVALGSLINGGTTTNRYGFYMFTANNGGGGTLTNQYGIYIPALTGATNNWTLYSVDAPSYHGGEFRIGSATDLGAYQLQVTKATTGQTTEARVANFSNAGATFDTTGGALSSYGGYFSSTSTRSAGANALTNIGLYATASGAQNNYAAIFDAGLIGLGTVTPTRKLDVVNIDDTAGEIATFSSNNLTQRVAIKYNAVHQTGGYLEVGMADTSSTARFGNGTNRTDFLTAGNYRAAIDANGMVIGSSYANGGASAPSNGLAVQGETLIGSSTDAGAYQLQVTGASAFTANTTTNSTFSLTSTGDFIIEDGTTDVFTVTDAGRIIASPTAGQNFSIAFTSNNQGRVEITPALYTSTVGAVDITRGGNFTGTAAETAIELGIQPSLTVTEPGSGTFTWHGADINMASIAVTAGAGTSVFNALRLAGVSDADAGTVRGLYVDNLTATAAAETAIRTGTGWDYAAIFDAGNVGIGTATPDAPLDIIGNEGTAFNPMIEVANTDTAGYTQIGFVGTGNTWSIGVGNSTETAQSIADDFFIYDYDQTSIRFVIDTTGEVGIGDNTPDYLLDVANTGTDGNIFALTDSDGECLYNPESGAVTVTCSSDERLKENIIDAPSALDYFRPFKIREYNVKASGDKMIGVIAQEVLLTNPELVTVGVNNMYSVQLPSQWQVVKGLQELDLKILDIESFDANSSFVNRMKEWLGDVANGIGRIFAKELKTEKLCITDGGGELCVTKADLQNILNQNQGGSGGGSTPTPPTDQGNGEPQGDGGQTEGEVPPTEGGNPEVPPEIPTEGGVEGGGTNEI